MSDERGTHTNGARFLVTRVFGLLAAAAAAEHGLGEALQGSRAAAGPFIQSWPDAALFRIEGGEPALTLLPNLVFGIGDAALIPVIFAAFVLFPLCVLASRAADAVPSRREISSLLSKEPR